jgi:hypothetical protein
MDPIKINPTPKTPTVLLDPSQGVIEIKGRSHPENSADFYKPVMNWLNDYAQNPVEKTVVNIQLELFNTSSSKCILDMFKKLEVMHKANNQVEVNWYYEGDDEDGLDAGENYRYMIGIPFNLIAI